MLHTATSVSVRAAAARLLLLGLVAPASMASTCADLETRPPEPRLCVVDEECDVDMVCHEGECKVECVADTECAEGQICRAELRGDDNEVVDVCMDDGSQNNGAGACRSDDDCAQMSEGARCGVDGVCYLPELSYGLLILDQTAVVDGEEPADGGFGADIAAIYLEDRETGEAVAWADTLQYAPATDVAVQNLPDGAARTLTEDEMCVDAAFQAAVTPLGGDGGYLLVRFLESQTGNPVATAPERWSVVVVEWGANCPGGELGEQDQYEVWTCEAPSFKAMDPLSDCNGSLQGPRSGRGVFSAEK